MRFLCYLILGLISLAPVRAAAAVWIFQYEANATGGERGTDRSIPGCIFCQFGRDWSGTIRGTVTTSSADGSGSFSFGDRDSARSGTIVALQSSGPGQFAFEGRNFRYQANVGNCALSPQCSYIEASAARFSVSLISIDGRPPVPEPSTWALMIGGFGAIGAALRRRGARAARAAY
jgi:hypothetical protein